MWLEEASPSMQKSAIGEYSEHLVALQPNEEDDDDAGVTPIDEGIAAAKIWEPGDNSDRKDDGLDPPIGYFALRGQLEISESECPRGGTHDGGRPRGGTHGEEVRKTASQMEEALLQIQENPPLEASRKHDEPLQWNSGAILQITRSKLFVNALLL